MNAIEAMRLFSKYDDPDRWEYPAGFDYKQTTERFREFVAAFDQATGIRHDSETGSSIQDASFHSEIHLGGGAVRFSNFGEMVSITPDSEIDPQILSTISALCARMGYTFVPSEFTTQDYTGKNPGVTGIRDWWIRYFDWV